MSHDTQTDGGCQLRMYRRFNETLTGKGNYEVERDEHQAFHVIRLAIPRDRLMMY